ncbi:MAG: DUF1667 domain-containing protein [Candidatus Omnitrophica bacterium]|nr:DUF1667 domain-containing protein [Candidatus Omnitrophota bacterium]
MIKHIICIECPNGCSLEVEIENNKVSRVSGNKCPKGQKYAVSEIENPERVLTTSVLAEGLPYKMISVRTDCPIPKARLIEAMNEVKKVRVRKPVKVGDVVKADLLGLGANLIATRRNS